MRIDVRCGFGGGKPCGNKVGTIPWDDLDFAHGVVTFDRLRWEERHYVCPDHGALQVYDEDLLRLALKPRKRYSIMAGGSFRRTPTAGPAG